MSLDHITTLDRTTVQEIARQAVADLSPRTKPALKASSKAKPRSLTVGPDVVVKSPDSFVIIEAKDARPLQISVVDLSNALEGALLKVIGSNEFIVLQGSFKSDAVMRKLMERLPAMIDARRRALTEKNIEALVDAYLPVDALAAVMPDIEADNARAVATFRKAHPLLTAEQVAERAGHNATNRSATANRWKRDHQIFAVKVGGREAYPSFQFKDGRPRSTLQAALQTLQSRSGWQVAFWFISPNGWLGGSKPIDRLADGAALAAAACHEVEDWAG